MNGYQKLDESNTSYRDLLKLIKALEVLINVIEQNLDTLAKKKKHFIPTIYEDKKSYERSINLFDESL